MEGVFVKGKEEFVVSVTNKSLSYRLKDEIETCFVPFEDILSVKLDEESSFTVYFAVASKGRKLKKESVTFYGEKAEKFALELNSRINNKNRPKKLLVIINPNSGQRKAEKIYKNKVKRLFELSGIEPVVKVTQAPKEAKQMLQEYDLSTIDGIVTVGGDGLYCECMTGLVLRVQKDAGVKYNSPEAKVVPATIPIGIIPAGSGDYIVQYLHGTRDVTTAALHIILGKRTNANVVGVHQDGELTAYSGLLLGFGLFGDIMYDCEKFRWMGPTRYNIIPVGTVLRRRAFDLDVEYQLSDTKEWQKVDDTMYGVDTYVITRTPKDRKMVPKFGDEAINLYMTSKCSFAKHVKQLAQVQDHKAECFDHEFVKERRVDAYKVRLTRASSIISDNGEPGLEEKYYINCDGEVITLTHPEFEARFHRNVIQLFGQAEV
ncbi:hypothetical protein SNE40_004825 [Patella caerulea]|uniref:DAGKc domain-containing protein n=1 Tax=Patella caerulea TaxID=87958 RepID=A0AAN8QCV6_PATCE